MMRANKRPGFMPRDCGSHSCACTPSAKVGTRPGFMLARACDTLCRAVVLTLDSPGPTAEHGPACHLSHINKCCAKTTRPDCHVWSFVCTEETEPPTPVMYCAVTAPGEFQARPHAMSHASHPRPDTGLPPVACRGLSYAPYLMKRPTPHVCSHCEVAAHGSNTNTIMFGKRVVSPH
jgi:hypothetical protein